MVVELILGCGYGGQWWFVNLSCSWLILSGGGFIVVVDCGRGGLWW